MTASAMPTTSKTKEKKAKQDEVLPDFEWNVGTGKKKGMST